MKIHWHGVSAAAASALALLLSPVVLGVLPPKAAAVVGALGIVYQAFSKPVVSASPTEAQQAASGK